MRYLILFFAFLSPITLLAQSEGTVEYSATTEMKMDMETVMANLPEEMQADSAMVAQMVQSFENMGNQQATRNDAVALQWCTSSYGDGDA